MGVVNLWTELVKYANVCRTWSGSARSTAASGEPRDENAEIVEELCGKVLAIDTSVWLFQCSQQNDLKEAIYDEHARVLYIFIFRIMNLLRYGVTPVFVLEGDTPEAKMGRLNQRSLARGLGGRAVGNRRGGRHDALGRKVVELLDAMGIPHVDAPGEAEAMCAALTLAGLAAAAVTSDVDALLFGARSVYKECRVQMDSVRLNAVERVEAAEAARRCFGLLGEGAGCMRALQAVACLCGCDYSVLGGKGVGVKTALEAVQQLTVGRQDDGQVIPELLRYLETGPDPRVTALTKCTGCKTCGHEKHGRQPCPVCGPGACRPKANSSPCECEFHRSEPQRKFMRVIARAVTTGPSFSSDCRTVLAAFESEVTRASQAAEELRNRMGSISWSHRPDVQAVFSLMHPLLGHTSSDPNKLLWTYSEVRDKMRPVLLEWDMRQGPEPGAAARAVVEFRPRRIKQVAAKDGGTWAYLMEFDRLPYVNPGDAELDSRQLANSKLAKGRHVRRTLVDRLWPHCVQLLEEEEQAKLLKPKKGRGGKAAAAASGGSPGGLSGASGVTAATGGAEAGPAGRAGGRADGRSGGVTRSGASQGSSDVMHRFLRMGATGAAAGVAPTASVQQPPPAARHAGGGGAGAGPSVVHRKADVAAGGGSYGYDEGAVDDEGELLDFEAVQMAQHNGGGGRSGAAASAAAAAGASGEAGPSQPVLGAAGAQVAGRAGAGTSAGAGASTRGGMVALWDAEPEPSEELLGDRSAVSVAAAGGRGPLYDNLDDVIPTSLDDLLASASQQPQQQPHHRTQRGGGRGADVQGADAAAAAMAAGAPDARPFRPQPTGPGPGRNAAAAAGGSGSSGGGAGDTAAAAAAAAPAAAGQQGPKGRAAGGDSGAGGGGGRGDLPRPAAVEVFDLTDSPVCRTASPARTQACTANTVAGDAGADVSELGLDSRAAGPGPCGIGENDPVSRGGPGRGGVVPDLSRRSRRRLKAEGYGALGEEQGEAGDGDEEAAQEQGEVGDAVGSAVKPARVSGAACPAEQKAGGGDGDGDGDCGVLRELDQEEQLEGSAEQQQQQHAAGKEDAGPAVRRARLMRSLFPDIPCSSAATAAAAISGDVASLAPGPRSRKADRPEAGEAGGAAQAPPPAQRQQQQQRRPDGGASASPSKRRNTGDGGGPENGLGGGASGRIPAVAPGAASAAAASKTATAAAAAAVHVDLTLTDDDEDQDVVDLT